MKKLIVGILIFLFIIFLYYYIDSKFVNTADNLMLKNDIDFINNIEMISIDSRETSITDNTIKFRGIEYRLFIKVPHQITNIDKIGFQLKYPIEISNILGTKYSGIQYGITKIEKENGYNIFQIEFMESKNDLTDNELNNLINNKDNIIVEIYFDNKLIRTID